jgi:hypothetical protein
MERVAGIDYYVCGMCGAGDCAFVHKATSQKLRKRGLYYENEKSNELFNGAFGF